MRRPFCKNFLIAAKALRDLKGLCPKNLNIENQQETCLQIDTYTGLIISFLDSNYTFVVSGVVTLGDETFSLQVIKN